MRTSRSFKVIVILMLLFLTWILLAWQAAEWLIIEKPLEKADAILVLSGSSVYIERTQKAASLYKKGVAPKIILTDDHAIAGWSEREKRNPPFIELMLRELNAEGIPREAIEILPDEVTGTEWEAKALAKKIKEENLNSVLLVTSAYHTRRAFWIFERVLSESGANAEIGIAHALTGEQTPPPFYWWLKPFGWNVVAGEYVKGAAFWLFY